VVQTNHESTIEEKLRLLGISLEKPSLSAGSYVPVVKTGNLIFVSGQLPVELGSNPLRVKFAGKVGRDISIGDGRNAAKLCVINALAHLKAILTNLDEIRRFVKLSGFINCEATFTNHPEVINGASDFLLNLFGEKGRHARVAVGMNSLPFDSAVEIDFIVEFDST
jgi:enamine deaminase RidA (YjgF/YER057c/UK114 family)